MKRSRFTQEQIIGVLKEHQAGATAADLCRKHGISDATFYTWRSKYGGMDVSDARKLKGLEEENAKLKKLLAEQMLDVATLKEMLAKTFDAWLAACSRDLGDYTEELLAAARVRVGRARTEDVSVCLQATRRRRDPCQAARAGR
jgi:putative transposase